MVDKYVEYTGSKYILSPVDVPNADVVRQIQDAKSNINLKVEHNEKFKNDYSI